jgi:hypothetical protein
MSPDQLFSSVAGAVPRSGVLLRASFTCCLRVVRAWWARGRVLVRAGSRIVRAGRAHCFVCRQRAVSRVSFARCRVVSLVINSSRLESLVLIKLLIYLTVVSVAD